MKHIGIWLDKEKAFIIRLEDGQESTQYVLSNIETFKVHGGSGTRFKGGPQDVVQDSKYLEREKHQFRNYFKEIVSQVKDADTLALFGPAGTNEKLHKELSLLYPDIHQKVVVVKKEDSMTENQMKALIRDFYTDLLQ